MLRITSSIIFLLLLSGCLNTPDPEQTFLAEIYYPELSARVYQMNENTMSENWLNIIDFGDKADYETGYIEHAVNIELKFFIDTNGYLVNRGKAITERFDNQWPFIVYSSSNDTIAYWAAKTIEGLGYPKVYFYEGGVKDWQEEHGDYLITTYPAVKEWHDQYFPFEDTLKAMVDVHPPGWYSGVEILEGHIPGALNIPSDELVNTTGEEFTLINNGAALTDLIPDRSAKIIVYHSEGESQRATDFLKAAMELEYMHLFLFKNGYDEWVMEGDSVIVK